MCEALNNKNMMPKRLPGLGELVAGRALTTEQVEEIRKLWYERDRVIKSLDQQIKLQGERIKSQHRRSVCERVLRRLQELLSTGRNELSYAEYKDVVVSRWTDDVDEVFNTLTPAQRRVAETATFDLAQAGIFHERYRGVPQCVPVIGAEVPGSAQHLFSTALDRLQRALLAQGQALRWRSLSQVRLHVAQSPDYSLAALWQALPVGAAYADLVAEVKGAVPLPKGKKAAAAAAACLLPGSTIDEPHPAESRQRRDAIEQMVRRLAQGALSVVQGDLALPFYRAYGVAVCGAELCVVAVTVEGTAEEVKAARFMPTGTGKAVALGASEDRFAGRSPRLGQQACFVQARYCRWQGSLCFC